MVSTYTDGQARWIPSLYLRSKDKIQEVQHPGKPWLISVRTEEERGANPEPDQNISTTQDWGAKEFARLDSRTSSVPLVFFVGVSSLLEVSSNKPRGLKCVCESCIPF